MSFTVSPGRVDPSTSGHSTTRPSIGTLTLWRKATISAYLLVVTETQAFGDLHPTAPINATTDTPA